MKKHLTPLLILLSIIGGCRTEQKNRELLTSAITQEDKYKRLTIHFDSLYVAAEFANKPDSAKLYQEARDFFNTKATLLFYIERPLKGRLTKQEFDAYIKRINQ